MRNLSYHWILTGVLTLLSGTTHSVYGEELKLCVGSFPKTALGNEVKPIVDGVIGLIDPNPIFADFCPNTAYRFERIEVNDSFDEISIKACFQAPLEEKRACVVRGASPVLQDPKKTVTERRRAAIERAVAELFNKTLYALPDTPLGYYSVLSCKEGLQFTLQLAKGAFKTRTFASCFYRLAHAKKTVDVLWVDAMQYYVRSKDSETIPPDGRLAVALAQWDNAPDTHKQALDASCRSGSFKGALLIPYLRPGRAVPETFRVPMRGYSAGPAKDSGSNPSGTPKQ